MPGFDGTGPLGQGPMTGRGMGYCGGHRPTGVYPEAVVAYQAPYYWGRGIRGRFGRGFGRGLGRGMGRRGRLGRRFW